MTIRLSRPRATLLLVALLFLLGSCKPGRNFTEVSLCFSLLRDDGSTISQAEFNRFLELEADGIYPKGFTVAPVTRKWFDERTHALLSEDSMMLIGLVKMNRSVSRRIDELRERYKESFHQDSVVRVDKKVKAWF